MVNEPNGHPARDKEPLTVAERDEREEDQIFFCDRELDLLGDIRGLNVLYAAGTSPLWVEGLSRRIGPQGSLTAVDIDEDLVEKRRRRLKDAGLECPVSLVRADVFDLPFEEGAFDLAYSAGFFHELDVREEPAEEALKALARVVGDGGRVASDDFVNSVPATQIKEEEIRDDLVGELFGRYFYGIGPPERLVALHGKFLDDVRWRLLPPYQARHLDKLFLAEDEPAAYGLLEKESLEKFRRRRRALRGRVRREGYTCPATLYVEGTVRKD